MFTCKIPIRVRYAETDQMGISHHAQYLVWFEFARVEYLRLLGFSYKKLEEAGLRLPVVETQVKYRSPTYFDDVLDIETWVEKVGKVKISFAYRIYNTNKILVAEGSTLLGCLDPSGKPKVIPNEIVEAITQGKTHGSN